MLSFAQFITEEASHDYKWIVHPKRGTIAVRQRNDEYGSKQPIHATIMAKHGLSSHMSGDKYDSLERGMASVRPHPHVKGKLKVSVNSYGKSGWERPVPHEVMHHFKKKFPDHEIYDQNKGYSAYPLTEAKTLFPQEPTGKEVPKGPLNLTVKEPHPGSYVAYHKTKRVGAVVTHTEDGKPSIFKSETHPDYRRRGVMRHLYKHVENKLGTHLTPSSTLSDDGHAFWSKYRPEAVKDDLRNHRDKLMGKELVHPVHGKGHIITVGRKGATAELPNKQNFYMSRDEIKKHGHLKDDE